VAICLLPSEGSGDDAPRDGRKSSQSTGSSRRRGPVTIERERVLDQAPQRLDPGRAAGEERVAREHEQRVVAAVRVERGRPQVEHLRRALEPGADVGPRQVRVLLPVVELPRDRQLDEVAAVELEHVRAVVVEEARVVAEAVLDEQARCPERRLPAGTAVAGGADAVSLERGEPLLEVAPLLVAGLVDGRDVRVGVVPDLVPGGEDRGDRTGVPVGGEARHEEGPGQRVLREQVENPREADLRAEALMADHAQVLPVTAVEREDRRLGVDVERQAGDHATARSASSSQSTFAAASAVIWPGPS
jgi:hypothetical protein